MKELSTIRHPGRRLVLAAAAVLLMGHGDGGDDSGIVHQTKSEALAHAFPDARRIERETLFLSKAEQQRLSRMAGERFETRLYTIYTAHGEGDEPIGYAVIDTKTVRTKAATFMVVLASDGAVRSARILAWQEPPEYEPGSRWLAQFEGKRRPEGASLREGIHSISGATLTSRTLSAGVRQVLAVHALRLADDQ